MIADNTPERRNLTVLSLAIIVFYIAGGAPVDHDLTLSIIHLKFNHPEVLKYFVWVMLLWFLYRYWVTNKNSHSNILINDRCVVNLKYRYVWNYMKKNKVDDKYYEGLGGTHLHCQGSIWVLATSQGAVARLTGFVGYIIRIHYMLKILPRHRATSDYYTPYLLFYSALCLGIYHSVAIGESFGAIALPALTVLIIEFIYLTRE